ncbi:MAG: hypothetical protein EOP48_00975 [Sphingobacteriales bacterium]|nr:MAG: hypothetical protein EOP48_00975 [Sphingobacteriales bacterium]
MRVVYTGTKLNRHFDSSRSYRVFTSSITQNALIYRLLADDLEDPALFDATEFTVVDTRLPKGWKLKKASGVVSDEGYQPLIEAGFWDDYFDGKESAVAQFREIASPLEAIKFNRSYIDRISFASWSSILSLFRSKRIELFDGSLIAASKLQAGSTDPEVLNLAGFSPYQKNELEESIMLLSSQESLDRRELALILGVWIVENGGSFKEPYDLYEDYVLNFPEIFDFYSENSSLDQTLNFVNSHCSKF